MKYSLLWLFPALLASAVNSSELDGAFYEMGTMTAQNGEETLNLVVPYDRSKDRGYAEQKMIMGSFLTINTAARLVDADGEPAGPTVQVTLQEQGGSLRLLSAELFDDQGFDAPMIIGPDGGAGSLTSYSFEDNVLTAEVRGTFLRLTGYMSGDPKPVEGAAPLEGVLTWQVTLPPLE